MVLCSLSIVMIWVAFVWWERGAPPGFRPETEDVTVDSINRYHRGVRIRGMARYDLRIHRGEGQNKKYLFPLMDSKNYNNSKIKVMVLSPKEPSKLASLEEVTIRGIARPPGNAISQQVYTAWRSNGFEFAPKFVLIEAFDDGVQ